MEPDTIRYSCVTRADYMIQPSPYKYPVETFILYFQNGKKTFIYDYEEMLLTLARKKPINMLLRGSYVISSM